jgi:hypothetical protein
MMSSSGRSAIDSVEITVTLGFAALGRRTMVPRSIMMENKALGLKEIRAIHNTLGNPTRGYKRRKSFQQV